MYCGAQVTGATSSPVGAIKACADALEDEARLHPTALDGQVRPSARVPAQQQARGSRCAKGPTAL